MNHVAVQLVGPDRLVLNTAKPTPRPGPTQMLARVVCVGLCFSDMKLLHQFADHPRKSAVLDGAGFADVSSYVPDLAPTVPGHEALLQIVEVGAAVTSVEVGGRYVVQADFRDLKTVHSNGAFGYNFEGALQQYVLLDERATIAADGSSYLLPVPDDRPASQLALIEPWACVEDAFRTVERRTLTPGGTVLLAGDGPFVLGCLDLMSSTRLLCAGPDAPVGFTTIDPSTLAPRSVDDLLIAGADPDLVESLFPLVANDGLILIATAGASFGRPVAAPIGRVHYGNVRLAATTGTRLDDARATIPATGELRPGDHVNVVGAGGPMGVMAMVRAIASSTEGALVEGGVRNEARAAGLVARVTPVAADRGVRLRLFDPDAQPPDGPVDYCFLMAPVAELVSRAVHEAAPGGIINVFAGLPADTPVPVDLDQIAAKGLYFIGTSGSRVDDMRVVLSKVADGVLDTNLSVGAITGMAGAIDGLRAVDARAIAGKVVVYPHLADLPLIELAALSERLPSVSALLRDGRWTAAAEEEVLRVCGC